MDNPKKEICTIRVIFPVDSDDEAIAIKKKISELLVSMTESQIQFSIMSSPTRPPLG